MITFLFPQVAVATTPVIIKQMTLEEKIASTSRKYGISEVQMAKTIECESNNNSFAVGDNGQSYGLVQIFLPAHPEVTKEQALDEDFALDFMGKEFKKGNQKIWSCWKKIYSIKDV